MSERWATIVKDDDGNEVISTIAQMEGAPPEVRSDEEGTTRVQKVGDGVLIGMVKGGPVDAVEGFGFPEGSPGAQGRGTGATRTADTQADGGADADADSDAKAPAKAKAAAKAKA